MDEYEEVRRHQMLHAHHVAGPSAPAVKSGDVAAFYENTNAQEPLQIYGDSGGASMDHAAPQQLPQQQQAAQPGTQQQSDAVPEPPSGV
jgi:hypothetical protein